MKVRPLLVLCLASALAFSGTANAGGQQVAVEVAPDGGSLLVRTYHCGTPAAISVAGKAEGVVNGQPRSLELKVARTKEASVFAVARQWPADGAWVLTFTTEGGPFVNALVELQPGAALRITSQASTRDKLTPRQVDAALQRLARR